MTLNAAKYINIHDYNYGIARPRKKSIPPPPITLNGQPLKKSHPIGI